MLKKKSIKQFFIAIFTLILGQGGILLASTLLALSGRLELLGRLGSTVMMLSLMMQVVDMGSAVTLCKKFKSAGQFSFFERAYTGTIAARLTCYFIITTVIIATHELGQFDTFFYNSFLTFAPFALAWTFNLSGIFDAINKSGTNSIFLTAPTCLVTVFYLICTVKDINNTTAAYLLGLCMGSGYTFAVFLQNCFLKRENYLPRVCKIKSCDYLSALRYGFSVMLTSLIGIINGRVQVGMGAVFLSPQKLGIFVLIRQILNGLNICTYYLRKVTLSESITSLLHEEKCPKRYIFINRASVYFALITTILALIASLLIKHFSNEQLAAIARAFLPFSLLILTSSFVGLYFQFFQITEKLFKVNAINVIALVVGTAVTITTIKAHGINAFFLGSITMFIVQTSTVAFFVMPKNDN